MLIETLPAAFEMDEILWELREHSAGLNCGRWDYIFSFIKTLREDPRSVMPDRCFPHTSLLKCSRPMLLQSACAIFPCRPKLSMHLKNIDHRCFGGARYVAAWVC